MKNLKFILGICLISLLTIPIAATATTRENQRLESICISRSNSIEGKITSYARSSDLSTPVSSEIRSSSGTRIKYSKNVSYNGKYPAATYATGLGPGATVRNGYGTIIEYSYKTETIYY